jgi:16S rRNA (cytosine967-C5)-methyltransferase
MPRDLRADAARVIDGVLAGDSLSRALPAMLERTQELDRPLLQQLCYGTLRQGPRLQAILDLMLDKPLRARDSDLRALLLCGLYQLDGTRIPDHAAVSATVAATRHLGKPWARGMTNALLRRYQREKTGLAEALGEAASAGHPEWLYRALHEQWPDQAAAIIAANNSQPPMTLRVNALRLSRDAYVQQLLGAGIEARPGSLGPQALRLDQPRDVQQLPGFADGLVSVQDEAAQMAAIILQPRAGDRVLDACAAPGGKACHLLELQPAIARLVAMDTDAQRLERVRENLQRLSLQAELVAADAARPPADLIPDSFDRILVDAPCSATGVIRRHPDVKLLRRQQDIGRLAELQLAILQGVWPLLRPGGILLYATCSVLSRENDGVVQAFAARQPNAETAPVEADWGLPTSVGRQLLPGTGGWDGLYYALLRKAS